MPDQYTLAAFRRLELTSRPRPPVMAEIDLVSSHTPWAPVPRMVDWDAVGDGSVYDGMPAQGQAPGDVWPDAGRVRAAYATSIAYSLDALTSFVAGSGDDDLVLVVLGDHQPASIVSGARRRARRPGLDHRPRPGRAGPDLVLGLAARAAAGAVGAGLADGRLPRPVPVRLPLAARPAPHVPPRCRRPGIGFWRDGAGDRRGRRGRVLHVHRSERADVLVEPLAGRARHPARTTRSRRTSSPSRPAAWSAGSPSGSRTGSAPRPASRTASARTSGSTRRPGWSPTRWPRPSGWTPTTTRGGGAACLGAARRSSTRPPASPGAAVLARHLGWTRDERRRAPRPPVPAGAAPGRAVRQLRRAAAAARPARWAAGRDEDGTGQPVPDDLPWQPRAVAAGCASASASPSPPERLAEAVERLARVAGPRRPRRRGSRCSARPGCPRTTCGCSARSPAPRRPPVAAAAVACAVAHRVRARARRRAVASSRSSPRTRCSRRWRATPASCRSGSAPSPHRDRHHPSPPPPRHAARRPAGAAARDDPDAAPHRAPRAATGPSRCTPATAGPARSRCCARCWSGCSPTTRRSSRATSS